MTESINFGKRTIDALSVPADKPRVRYKDTGNRFLYLDVFGTGKKTFLYVRWINGKTSFTKIGNYPELTPTEARIKADELSRNVANGVSVKARRTGGRTFATLFADYLEKHLKPNTRQWPDAERQFNVYLKPLHNIAAKQITPEKIRELQRTLAKDHGTTQANRVVQLIRAVYNFVIKEGAFIPNPAAKFEKFKEKTRARYLDAVEIGRFFKALEDIDPDWQDFFKMALFTGARRANVQSIKWNDIDIKRRLWTIPAAEFKTGDQTEVVLSEPVIEILVRRREKAKTDYVFPSHGKTGHVMEPKGTWKKLLEKAEIKDFHLHDLRRTFGSYQAAQGTSLQIIGKSLGHKGTDATAIYARMNLDPVRESVDKATAAMLKAANGVEK